MKKIISPNDCKYMFNDHFKEMTLKEVGVELKHYYVGTAPEKPSFLVNQDNVKRQLIERFSKFFEKETSQGLDVVILKSNYGNGKSHFIRTINGFFEQYDNVITKSVSLKQEKTDLKLKVLEGIGQKGISDCAKYIYNKYLALNNGFAPIEVFISYLTEEYSLSNSLATLIYEAVASEDISIQAQALSILKGNYSKEYLKTFKIPLKDVTDANFKYDVIKLVCKYMVENSLYMVIVFDEYEHIFTWKDTHAQSAFFADVKYFLDYLSDYSNLFFVFAESAAADEKKIADTDPAYLSRLKNLTITIDDISSPKEIEHLFNMLKIRYEKYYDVNFDGLSEEIFKKVLEDDSVKSNSNYRAYGQAITKTLDKYKSKAISLQKNKKKLDKDYKNFNTLENQLSTTNDLDEKTNENGDDYKAFKKLWDNSSSVSKKSILFDNLKEVLLRSSEQIIDNKKRKGFFTTNNQGTKCCYYVIYTNYPTLSDLCNRKNELMNYSLSSGAENIIMIYPFFKEVLNNILSKDVLFFDRSEIVDILWSIKNDKKEIIHEIKQYLENIGLRNAYENN